MANPYVPINLRVLSYFNDKVVLNWDFPEPSLELGYVYKVYASPSYSSPIAGPEILTSPRSEAELYSTGNFYVAVTSVNIHTSEESTQSATFFISLDHTADGLGGAIAKSQTGVPKFLKTDEAGQIAVAILPGSGIATEAKQDDTIVLLNTVSKAVGGSNTFFEFWELLVPSSVLTQVTALTVPVGENYKLTGLYITGRTPALVELKVGVTTKWRGRTNDVDSDKEVTFYPSGINAAAGQTFTLDILHDHTSPIVFAGNLFGTIK